MGEGGEFPDKRLCSRRSSWVMFKNQGLAVILVFVVGIAVGWFSRGAMGPGPVEEKAAAAVEAPANTPVPAAAVAVKEEKPAVPGKRAIRDATPKKARTEPDPEQMKKIQGQVAKAMAGRQRAKFEQHITKLSESLSLTEAQKQGLTKWLDERIGKLESMDLTDPSSMTDLGGVVASLTNKALEEELAKSLTEEQKASLAGFKEREIQSKVDALALKNLSQMQGVLAFEEGQRDEVYKILAAAAEEKITRQAENPDPSSLFTDGMGIELDPYDLGIQDAMTEAFKGTGQPGEVADRKAMAENLRKVIDDRISAKVDQLRPVLNEKQLEQYRTELKNKGSGFLGNALIGLEGSDGEGASSSTIVIPVE